MVPRISVADAQIELVEFGVINDGVPDRAAAAAFTPVTLFSLGAPCAGRRGFQNLVACGVVGLSFGIGCRIKPPCLFARGCVISRDISACAKFSAAEANHHFVLHDARNARNCPVGFDIQRLDAPVLFTGCRIERNQPPVDGADEHAALPKGYSAIDDVAAGFDASRLVDFGIKIPQWLAGFRVIGEHFGPCRGYKHLAIDHDWRCLLAARIGQIGKPGDAKILHIFVVNLSQRAVALLIIIEAGHGPVRSVTA